MADIGARAGTYKETEIGALPRGWEAASVGSVVVSAFGGGTPSTKREEYWDGEVPWTTSATMDSLYLRHTLRSITAQGLANSSSKVVPKGNLLVGTRVGVGKVAVNEIDVAISQDLTGLVIDSDRLDVHFGAYAIGSPLVQEQFALAMRGSTIKGIPRRDLLSFVLPLPTLAEQRKIAAVLGVIRRAIEATDKVIAAAQELKKSLMHHLFTYGPVPVDEAENVPLKETEVGQMPEEWDVVALREVARIRYGLGQPPASDSDGVPMIRATNIKSGRIVREGLLRVRRDRIPTSRNPFLKPGDVIVVRSGAYTGDVAMVTSEWEGSVAGYDLVVSPTGRLLPAFCAEFLLGEAAQTYFKGQRVRSAQPHLNSHELGATQIPLPPLPVQRKTAGCLRLIDTKFAAEQDRKAALESLFKTMLHLLMTGQVRVKDWEPPDTVEVL